MQMHITYNLDIFSTNQYLLFKKYSFFCNMMEQI
jgi:hypothetical protein